MHVVFVGGGSFRTLPIVRAALGRKGGLHRGKITLVDFNLPRVETVGRLIMQTPEYRDADCTVTWTDKLDKALPGADMVSVSFPVGSGKVCALSDQACNQRGFIGGDQISPSGAFRSLTGGAVLLDIARRMEKHCPKAWLVDFANPVAVYSGMVNNHTRIRALGVCGGMSNHRWDLTRLLFDRDEFRDEFKVSAAGINHLSILLRGTWHGQDIYKLLDRALSRKDWKPCRIPTVPHSEKLIQLGLRLMAEMYRRFGKVVFSTEGDGHAHVFYDELGKSYLRSWKPASLAAIKKHGRMQAKSRRKVDLEFRALLDGDLDDAFWAQKEKDGRFAPDPHFPTSVIIRALSGNSREWLAASRPNRGAVRGFKDRTVLEYSMILDRDGVHPEPDLEVPDAFHGLITSLATHQTLLGDAIATQDPKLLAAALFAYPIYQNSTQAKALWRDLLAIHAGEIPAEFQAAVDYF